MYSEEDDGLVTVSLHPEGIEELEVPNSE